MQARYALPWLVVVSVVLACGVALGAEGQEAEKKEEEPKPEPLVVKVYRVEELFVKRDWTPGRFGFPDVLDSMPGIMQAATAAAGGEIGIGFGDLFGISSSELPTNGTHELVDIIKRIVNNTNYPKMAAWSDEGGPGAIECLTAQNAVSLIVTQTPEGQEKVEELLDSLRAQCVEGGPVVTVSAQWVEVDEGKARQLIRRDPKRLVPMEITAADIEKAGAKVVYRGSTTCFDRQCVFVSSGKLKVYLGDVTPVCTEATIGLSPIMRYLLVGAMLEVRPQLSKTHDTVLLDFRSFVNQSGTIEYRPVPDIAVVDKRWAPIRVDLGYPEVDFHTLRGSIRIPLDKTILVGGCTSAKMKDGKVLYLIVEVSASKDPREAAVEAPRK